MRFTLKIHKAIVTYSTGQQTLMLHHAEIVLENVILAYYTSICKLSVLVDILQYSVSFYIYNHFCSMWKDVGDFFFSLFQFLISTI